MKKRFLATLLSVCLTLTLLPVNVLAYDIVDDTTATTTIWDGTIADSYAGGSGTSSDPYQIETAAQLAKLASDVNSGRYAENTYYTLTADIYLNDTDRYTDWEAEAPANYWTPIGNESTAFKGAFYGNDHRIYGIYIDSDENYQGLFGNLDCAKINGIGIVESFISGGNYVGGIAGYALMASADTNIEGCYNKGIVNGADSVGGIIGEITHGTIVIDGINVTNCYNEGNIAGNGNVGGIVGHANMASMSNCYNVGEVTGTGNRVGGIAGRGSYAWYCWNLGKVSGIYYVSGIIGSGYVEQAYVDAPSYSRCFNAGDISGSQYVGGISGYASSRWSFSSSTIDYCYNIGTVSATGNYVAGICPWAWHIYIKNCYNTGAVSGEAAEAYGAVGGETSGCDLENDYYLVNSCSTGGSKITGTVTEKTGEDMREADFVTALNNGASRWITDNNNYNSGYPILDEIEYEVYSEYAKKLNKPSDSTSSIYFDTDSLEIEVGETKTIVAFILSAYELGESDFSWSVDNPSILEIVDSGYHAIDEEYQEELNANYLAAVQVKGLSAGITTVTVQLSVGASKSCDIIVTDGSNMSAFDRFVKGMPKLTEDQATRFLKFIYGVSAEESVSGISRDDIYRLLIGDVSKYDGSLTKLKADIVIFSVFTRAQIAAHINEESQACVNSANTMVSLLTSTIPNNFDSSLDVVDEYTNALKGIVENGLLDYFSTALASASNIHITETIFENISLVIGTYGEALSSFQKMQEYLTYLQAAVEGVSFAADETVKNMYTYFNCYITDRPSYNSSEDNQFRDILSIKYEAIKLGSSGSDLALTYIGVDTWHNHRDQLDYWAEYLCELEKYAGTLFNMENEVEVSGCDVVYGLSYNISVNAPAFATVRYGTEEGNYPYIIPIPYVNSGRYTTYYCITAPHYQTITGSAIVNIAKANRSLEITSGNMTLNQGASGSILYSINKDADGSAKYAISFSNSNPSVASVDEYGVVTAKSAGTSIITVKLNETKNYNLAEPQEVLVTVIGNEVTMPEEYSIIYAPNGGAGEMPSTTAKNGELFIFPACNFTAPEGKEFKAWSIDGAEYAPDDTYTFTGDTTVTAVWQDAEEVPPVITTYTVTFDPNGGDGTMEPVTATEGMSITLPTCDFTVPEGTEFKAWSIDGAEYDPGDMYTFTSDTTVTAIWQDVEEAPPVAVTHTVTFDANGGTIKTDALTTGTNGKLSSLPTPTRSGYTFSGWYTAPSSGVQVTTNTVFDQDTTVYAHWTLVSGGSTGGGTTPSAPTYAVTAPSNMKNGTVSINRKNASKGTTVTITVTPDEGYELDELTVTDKNGDTLKLTKKGDGRYTFTMPASKVTISAFFAAIAQENEPKPAEWSNPYTDVPEGVWYYDAVKYVTEHGLMGGAGSSDTFQPAMTTTRGMIMTILARMNGVNTEGGAAWYEKGMEWAVANGVSDGTNPEKNISRQELVTMLWRYAGEPSGTWDLSGYPDAAETDTWAVDAMKWAAEHGVITHTGEGLLNPTGPATRMEVATILMRFCEDIVK